MKIRRCRERERESSRERERERVRERERENVIHLDWKGLKDANGRVATKEGDPVEKKVTRVLDALIVASPVFEAVGGEILENVESFRSRDIPMSLLLDLIKKPRFDDGATSKHHRVYPTLSFVFFNLLVPINIMNQQESTKAITASCRMKCIMNCRMNCRMNE